MQKTTADNQQFNYYDFFAILIVVLTLITNIVSYKMVGLGPFTLRLGVFVAAASHILADILVEVYGFARARRVIWMNVIGLALMFVIFKLAVWLPGASGWEKDAEFNMIFNRDLPTILATIFAVFAGHVINAMIMTKMKLMMDGDSFWLRAIASSFVAAGVSAIIFYSIANVPGISSQDIVPAVVSTWFVRLAYEIVLLPITYSLVVLIKKAEGVDVFDIDTNLNPFRFSIVKK